MNVQTSASLTHYLSTMLAPGHEGSPSTHLERGGNSVQPADLAHLRELAPALTDKMEQLTDSPLLLKRLRLLRDYIMECPVDTATVAHRETAFALYYLLHGNDLIPDTIPHIGLLDDALLIEAVLWSHTAELREHWAAHGRNWPEHT